mmetsp:Transcript_28463/g.74790  ORF Transcript_28463/g.74790 Transcript_28463/m.74790 type:complete len:793 (+) Transcript_28463:124-2502(+)
MFCRTRFAGTAIVAWLATAIAPTCAMHREERLRYRDEVAAIFDHGYGAYMDNAYPADELMPLSCKGRIRGVDPSRGDIDDALGNFSLTLVDSLDSLAVMGRIDEFLRAVQLVIANVKFDADFVVSVFETNIRVLGGLLGAHTAILALRQKDHHVEQYPYLSEYNGELVTMAVDLGDRLLLAFDTATGIPYSRVNLLHGLDALSRKNTATCTACAGTILLEFGALSRFSGDPKFEEAARRAMEALWSRRAVHTELVGETINVTSGAWTRTDAGIGAGIDSYYEYLLKSYILFGDATYLEMFNRQYDAVMEKLRKGPYIFHANMNQPQHVVRQHLDSLQMFWPGLQVLHGDLSNAKEMHRMHFELAQRYGFSPEGYTPEFNVHWGNWPLRPEFIESTYFLYRATKDPFYLGVGKQMVDDLMAYTKVDCGFAAILDVRHKNHEDKMDSFFLAETVKYLYLLFSEPEDLVLNMDDFVYTTEAHLLPLRLARVNLSYQPFTPLSPRESAQRKGPRRVGCAAPTRSSTLDVFMSLVRATPESRLCLVSTVGIRAVAAGAGGAAGGTRIHVQVNVVPYDPKKYIAPDRLNVNRKADLDFLRSMGIFVVAVDEGFRLTHHSNLDGSGGTGLGYMKELMQKSERRERDSQIGMATVRAASPEGVAGKTLVAAQASFGYDLDEHHEVFGGHIAVAQPLDGCKPLTNGDDLAGNVVVVKRGGCMFIEKVRHAQHAGADSVIVVDNRPTDPNTKLFTMSGDGVDDVNIPAIFVTLEDGEALMHYALDYREGFTIEIFSSKWEGS